MYTVALCLVAFGLLPKLLALKHVYPHCLWLVLACGWLLRKKREALLSNRPVVGAMNVSAYKTIHTQELKEMKGGK